MTAAAVPRLAVLGHQEDWQQISAIVHGLRPAKMAPVSIDDLRTIIPWIPPRTVSRFSIHAERQRSAMDAVFIDTFLTPDDLGRRPSRQTLDRIKAGIMAAEREGAALITLGGFTSILFESDRTAWDCGTAVTTGNTLTAALIVEGVKRAVSLLERNLEDEEVLIIGASGDVGSACARALAGHVRKLVLAGRNASRLQAEAAALAAAGPVTWSTDTDRELGAATLIVAAASTPAPMFKSGGCHPEAIICDAGYPKNISTGKGDRGRRLFWGGLGQISGGFKSADGMLERFYGFPVPEVAHGCILEGAVLALAGRFESFSRGRGRIRPDSMIEILRLATEQGVGVAPLFNGNGLWPEELRTQSLETMGCR